MRLKRKVLEQNRNSVGAREFGNNNGDAHGSEGMPFEQSVLAPRTKWRAIVSSRVSPNGAEMPTANGNGERRNGTGHGATPGHDALVNGLFGAGNTNGNAPGRTRRGDVPEIKNGRTEKRRRINVNIW